MMIMTVPEKEKLQADSQDHLLRRQKQLRTLAEESLRKKVKK